MAKIFIQRRVKPYQATGKTTFNLKGIPGVYLIYKNDIVVYVGYSGTNLYKTMYRHFQKWNDKTQKRVTYSDLGKITVRVIYTNNAYKADKLEKALILKYKPKDNNIYYEDLNPEPLIKLAINYMDEPINPIITSTEDLPF